METRTGAFVPIHDEAMRKRFSKAFQEHMAEAEVENGEERRRAGPPIFTEGEVLEIRGGLFKVTRISKRKLFLRAVRG